MADTMQAVYVFERSFGSAISSSLIDAGLAKAAVLVAPFLIKDDAPEAVSARLSSLLAVQPDQTITGC